MKIGIIPMSAKPYHVGHDMLVNLAASECNEVHLFVSTSDRENVSGEAMTHMWKNHIEKTLPGNVVITYGGSPITNAWKDIGQASEIESMDTYVIYSDPDDLSQNFPNDRLEKYASWLFHAGQVTLRPVKRTETVNVSGTEMRLYLASNEKDNFVRKLPRNINSDIYWAALQAGSSVLRSVEAKTRSRKVRR
jgi:hypothetical protein